MHASVRAPGDGELHLGAKNKGQGVLDRLLDGAQIPLLPRPAVKIGAIVGDVEAQAQRALDNLLAVVAAAGSDKSQVLKTTVFLKDMNDFAKVNVRLLDSPQAIYEKAFAPYKPARSAVEVARLPRDVLVEVECIAAARE